MTENDNDNGLRPLIAKRATTKSKITRFMTFLNSVDSNNPASIINIKQRIPKIDIVYNEYEEVQTKIELLDATQANDREIFEHSYFEAMTAAQCLLERCQPVQIAENNPAVHNRADKTEPTIPADLSLQVKLPPISLPSFAGANDEWLSFYETFTSMIHNEASLTDLQKLYYLKSCLKGEAANVINTLATTAGNYQIAFDLLIKRYENKRLIIKNHVTALFELQNLSKSSSRGLRNLIDNVELNIKVLKNQSLPTEHWDILLIYLVLSKLDYNTKRDWEQSNSDDIPNFKTFTDFLDKRCKILESLEFDKNQKPASNQANNSNYNNKSYTQRAAAHVTVNKKPKCSHCNQTHFLHQCEEFLNLSVDERIKRIETLKLCKNCMKGNHTTNNCRFNNSCKTCNKRHHSLIHISNQQTANNELEGPITALSNCCNSQTITSEVILSTALVQIPDIKEAPHDLRALLDVGSQTNFITKATCIKLKLKLIPINFPIVGITQSISHAQHMTKITIKSRYNNFHKTINCLVLSQITSNLPLTSIPLTQINIPMNIKLADPTFNTSGPIDLLLGAEVFWELLNVGQIKTCKNQPYFQKTELGWIIGGAINPRQISPKTIVSNVAANSNKQLEAQISKFWEIEQYNDNDCKLSPEEQAYETHFKNFHKRDERGRFIVKLPFKENITSLGQTKEMALRRFYSLEKRLNKDSELKNKYSSFINEYLNLGHMEPVPPNELNSPSQTYYLPHHAVFKESSQTTKIRVVFDASATSSTGISLNDTLLVGPTIQDDLYSILVRFRTHEYVLSADISKMYRQVLIDPEQRNYQRILWRENDREQVQTFRLNTVTYGTASAPFLAIRSLHQLALDAKDNFELASETILRDFYVDDILTGTNDLHKALQLRDELISLLARGGFELRQWASNNKQLLPNLNDSDNPTLISLDKQGETKTLGVTWNCNQDSLKYYVKPISTPSKVTKRVILSTISQLFDPLGLIGPILINIKVLLQRLWTLNSNWDESVPFEIHTKFTLFLQQLTKINSINIPRKIAVKETTHFELHGFCDASEIAYGACVYLKSVDSGGNIKSQLISAKSKVAPLKTVSIPRLELCAAVLLVNIVNKLTKSLCLKINSTHFWSDSTIVLSWLSETPNNWKTFVANRISKIQSHCEPSQWRHIDSKSNPADIISRGTTVEALIDSTLWWNGPEFLVRNNNEHLNKPARPENVEIPERRKHVTLLSSINQSPELMQLFEKFSNFNKLVRVISYCFRFVNNCKLKSPNKNVEHLTCDELNYSKTCILKIVQQTEFSHEINVLKRNKRVNNNSKILSLNPFVCKDGLLRAGGRLRQASAIPFNQRFPIILPEKNHITTIIISTEHKRLLHAGPLATLSSLRQTYWPISGRNSVRHLVKKCIQCFRTSPKPCNEMMGDLPKHRIKPSRPFVHCGLDYAGPLQIKEGRGRGKRLTKAYIAVFVCFATRAIHLELVSDLTSESFFNALKRFISRRGYVANIYSDNATNFVGANNELKQLKNLFMSQGFKDECLSKITQCNIKWHFIPPKSPNFGGLWEAAVKSCKRHLKRVVANANLTFEEMYTVLVRIEACLNSRPLTPLSNSPDDLSILTPGHFLIGDSMTSFVEPNLTELKLNTLSRWQYVERLRQMFWKKWYKEYLAQLQERTKWKGQSVNPIKFNDLVLIKEDNLPPLQWMMGRVTEVHPGADGLIRAVTVKTVSGSAKRAISKICVFSIGGGMFRPEQLCTPTGITTCLPPKGMFVYFFVSLYLVFS